MKIVGYIVIQIIEGVRIVTDSGHTQDHVNTVDVYGDKMSEVRDADPFHVSVCAYDTVYRYYR